MSTSFDGGRSLAESLHALFPVTADSPAPTVAEPAAETPLAPPSHGAAPQERSIIDLTQLPPPFAPTQSASSSPDPVWPEPRPPGPDVAEVPPSGGSQLERVGHILEQLDHHHRELLDATAELTALQRVIRGEVRGAVEDLRDAVRPGVADHPSGPEPATTVRPTRVVRHGGRWGRIIRRRT